METPATVSQNTAPIVPPIPPPPTPRKKNVFLIGLVAAVALVILIGIGLFLFLQSKSTTPNILTPSPNTSEAPISIKNHDFVYVKDGNVYTYSVNDEKEEQLTFDGSIGGDVTYKQPKWVAAGGLSAVRCAGMSPDGQTPYTCSLIYPLQKNVQAPVLVSLTSVPNSNGYHIGGEISVYAWDKTATRVAYLAYEGTGQAPDFANLRLHIKTLNVNNDQVIGTFIPNPGRGGSLDDSSRLAFSSDGAKLMLVYTGFYPVIDTVQDTGTLYVYNLSNNSLLWNQPEAFITFGSWLNDNLIVAKRQKNDNSWYLITINPLNNTVNELADATGWYDIEPLDQDKISYFSLTEDPGAGIEVFKYDLSEKITTRIVPNVLPITVLADGLIAVRTTRSCTDDPEGGCGMDQYNGVVEDNFALLDHETGALTPVPISSATQFITDIDVK